MHNHKWVRFYLYFCEKYDYPPTAPTVLGPYLTKLAAKAEHEFGARPGLDEDRCACFGTWG